MKILFIVPSYKPATVYGGTIVVIAMLAEQLVELGHDVTVYTTTANGHSELNVSEGVLHYLDGVKVFYFRRLTGDPTHISFSLWRKVYDSVKSFDVVHLHSWWNFLILGTALICNFKNVQPIFSPHGMLSDYILTSNNRRKKSFLHNIIGKFLLKRTVLHVTSEAELGEAKIIIPEWQGAVIPNLVFLSENRRKKVVPNTFTIGFLSRIDPKKGLNILIEALSMVNFDYKLIIAGSGDSAYINNLIDLSINLGNSSKIEWVGWLDGEEKFDFLSEIDVLALPSHNENFAIVIIEALSVGTPVVISKNVGLSKYVLDNNLGWICESLIPMNFAAKLDEVYNNDKWLKNINLISPELIRKDFDPKELANKYGELYSKFISV